MESKSLKLYLWSFRDRPVFAEALAAEGYLLEEDVETSLGFGARMWDQWAAKA